jgi:hypothetical protein
VNELCWYNDPFVGGCSLLFLLFLVCNFFNDFFLLFLLCNFFYYFYYIIFLLFLVCKILYYFYYVILFSLFLMCIFSRLLRIYHVLFSSVPDRTEQDRVERI